MKNTYGYIYAGDYTNQKKYGKAKLGMTMIAPSQRRATIQNQSGHKYRQTAYIRIKNITKEDLLFIESWCRRFMAKSDLFTYDADSNDHFTYTISKNHEDMRQLWAREVMRNAVDCLRFMGYNESDWSIKECR